MGTGFPFWGEEHGLKLDCGDGCTTLCIHPKPPSYTVKGEFCDM